MRLWKQRKCWPRKTRHDFYTKKNPKESPKTSVTAVFMCILQFSSSICSRVRGTVRVGALKRLYSIDLSLKEGLGSWSESRAACFSFYYFALSQKVSENRFSTCTDVHGSRLECCSWGNGHIHAGILNSFSDRLLAANFAQILYYLEAQTNVWVVKLADAWYFLSHPKGPKAEIT